MQNRHLVPDKIEEATTSRYLDNDRKGKATKKVDPNARGLGLKKLLSEALAQVDTLPR